MKTKIFYLLSFFAISCTHIDIQIERQRGINQYESDSLTEAINTFSQVIKTTDTCAGCFQYRAFAYKDLGKYDSALSDFNSFINLDTTQAVGYANRASIYYMKNNYINALKDFQKALYIKPGSKDLYNPISHMLFATGQKDSACVYYQKSMAVGDTTFDQQIKIYCNNK